MLILYYSNSGTTARAAQHIQAKTNGKLIELDINPAYPTEYDLVTEISKQQIDSDTHPQITNLPDLTDEKTIFIGFPIWYQRPPMFVNTFFEQSDLKGKTVIPFATSMSTPMSANTAFLEEMAENSGATLQAGFLANSNDTIDHYLSDRALLK
ncbi:flavodoxin [Levilactobacillus fujinensis]|uniref:Flavodoxin n=1 Tax=Levilactobacillus fujinensis TaxID=2486024 RepID=A0ABW1TGY4_9LACO|nr:flavodoxin [Levilactobacillus fujinensis]